MRKALICLLIAAVVIGLVGCGKAQSTSPNQPKSSSKTITIGAMPDVESIPFIIAEKNGYFAEEGVNVKIEHFKSARDRDSALQAGQLDGVITDVVAVVFSNEGGTDLKIISQNHGDIKLMAGKDSGIKNIQELKGRSIGYSSNTIMEYTLDRMLESAGVKPGDVEKAAIPPLPTRLEMLRGGKIDAAILPEPLAGLGVSDGAAVLMSTDEMGKKAGAIAFTASSIKENPDKIKAIFRAYNKGVKYLAAQTTKEDLDYIIDVQGFPAELKGSLTLPEYKQAAAPDPDIVADVVAWMKGKQLIKGDYRYADLVNENVLR